MTLATDQKLNTEELSACSLALLNLRDPVLDYWLREVRARVEGAATLLQPILINTIPSFYDNLAEALTPGLARSDATSHTNVASVHGGERARMTNYGPEQVIHEYQILKEALLLVARQHGVHLGAAELDTVERSINAAVRESVREFSAMHEGLRARLAATLSHDMRTPLAVIISGAELVALHPDPAVVAVAARKIAANGRRLDDMIGDLLDALTVERGERLPLTLTRFDIRQLAHTVAQEFSGGPQTKLEVLGEPVHGYWCRDSMRRALENLVNNAVKYGDGEVISIAVAETHGRMMLSVHNTGDAIPENYHDAIFAYLQRGAHGGAGADGRGIGLPFVRNVAESHGGSAAVDSSAERGTTFIVDIPVDARPFVAPASASDAVAAHRAAPGLASG